MNGDGYSDVIVGAPHYTNGQTEEGRAFVYLGSATGLVASPSSVLESNQASSEFATSLGTAGDVNSDGYSDVIIGAPHFTSGQDREGRAFLYLGSAGGLGASPSWIAESNQIQAEFGISVATAGDVDGDGFSDVIIGAIDYDNGHISEGKAVVYYGGRPTLQLAPGWSVESNEDFATLGLPVATAGDVNDDGFSDVIVGSLSNGNVDVYHGSAASLSLTASLRRSFVPNARFGHSVAAAGDTDGNGTSEFIIGAPFEGASAGIAYLVDANDAPIWTAVGGQAFAQFGNSVAGAGDVNGDGYSDLLVGANLYSNGQINEGRAFLYHGSSSGPPTPRPGRPSRTRTLPNSATRSPRRGTSTATGSPMWSSARTHTTTARATRGACSSTTAPERAPLIAIVEGGVEPGELGLRVLRGHCRRRQSRRILRSDRRGVPLRQRTDERGPGLRLPWLGHRGSLPPHPGPPSQTKRSRTSDSRFYRRP